MSLKELVECLSYDSMKGTFHWDHHPTRPSFVGKVAGSVGSHGYRMITYKRKKYPASHVAYYIMTGKFVPKGMVVDHINRKRSDDRWANLYLSTYSENNKNVTTKSNTGVRGIRSRGRRFEVYINGEKGSVYVGSYPSLDEAVEVRSWYEAPF